MTLNLWESHMPFYIVKGKGKDSGRKRKPIEVFAKDQESALAKAKKQGIAPECVELLQVTHFIVDVAGISHRNRDQTDRQGIVKSCRIGEMLILEHEAGNPHDVHAITVCRGNGNQVGYIPATLADELIRWRKMGCHYSAAAMEIHQIDEDTELLTVQLCIFLARLDAHRETVIQHLAEVFRKFDLLWQAEHFLPKEVIGSRQWSSTRRSPGNSLEQFDFTEEPVAQWNISTVRYPTPRRVGGKRKTGCLMILAAMTLGFGLFIFGMSVATHFSGNG
jgi:hypothetical protein